MLSSSAGIPNVTVIQGNLKVNGGTSAAASQVAGTLVVNGQISANGGLAVQSGNLSVSPGQTNLASLNVAGSGVIGTPFTGTSLTVNGNIAQNNTAAANTYNGLSNAFSGSVTVGGGAGPGAGSVTASNFINSATNAAPRVIPVIVAGVAQANVTGPLTASGNGALPPVFANLCTVNLLPSFPEINNYKSVYFRVSDNAANNGGDVVRYNMSTTNDVERSWWFTGGANTSLTVGAALFDADYFNIASPSGAVPIGGHTFRNVGGTVPVSALRTPGGQVTVGINLLAQFTGGANSINFNTALTNIYLWVYPIL
jgi:hypothetical protein